MTLKDCTKAELLFVIKRMQCYMLSGDDYYIRCALLDVEEQREEKKHAEAKRLLARSAQKRQEYIELLGPYEGKSFGDIPDFVLTKADAAMKAAQAADRKWNHLMGIHTHKR